MTATVLDTWLRSVMFRNLSCRQVVVMKQGITSEKFGKCATNLMGYTRAAIIDSAEATHAWVVDEPALGRNTSTFLYWLCIHKYFKQVSDTIRLYGSTFDCLFGNIHPLLAILFVLSTCCTMAVTKRNNLQLYNPFLYAECQDTLLFPLPGNTSRGRELSNIKLENGGCPQSWHNLFFNWTVCVCSIACNSPFEREERVTLRWRVRICHDYHTPRSAAPSCSSFADSFVASWVLMSF